MPPAAHTTTAPEGSFIGPYRVVRCLARGATWDVYLARSGGDQRQAVVKIPRQAHPDGAALLARAGRAALLEHPNCARIHAAGTHGEALYVAQEVVADPRGVVTDLATECLNHGGRLPEDRVRVLAKQILEALAAAHGAPGGGFVHSRLSAGKILLNEQRRAKLVDVGLLADPSNDLKAADLRAAGAILYALLTGEAFAPGAAPPSRRGLARGWDRVLRELLEAHAEALPDAAALAERALSVEAGAGARRWLLPLGLAAALAATIGLAGMTVLHRRERAAAAQAQAARDAGAAQTQALESGLTQARNLLQGGDLDSARRETDALLGAFPHNGRVRALAADVLLASRLAAMQPARQRAESAWSSIADVDPGQGLGALLDECRGTLAAARAAAAEAALDQAASLYAQAAEKGEAILALDAQRRATAPVRQDLAAAREAAADMGASDHAAELWEQAGAAAAAGDARFAERRFTAAAENWSEAAETYARAERQARTARRLTAARAAYDAAWEAAGPDARGALPSGTRETLARLAEDADRAVAAEDWTAAASAWEAAIDALQAGLATTSATLARQRFEAAVVRSRDLLGQGRLGPAREAVAEALRVAGYQEDPGARALQVEIHRRLASSQAAPQARGNLVLNGDFALGQDGAPMGWTKPDNLTVFWEDGGIPGKALRLDTDVYRSEWEAHRANPQQPVVKTPTTGTRYNTVGGTAGVAVYAHPIEVTPGAYYRVSYDVKGRGEPFLYIKGYWKCGPEHLKDMGEKIFFQPVPSGPSYSLVAYGTSGEEKRQARAGDYIQSFRRRVVARFPPGKQDTWRRYETVLQLPPDRPMETVLLELYAYWPPGTYWFDNVCFEQVAEAEHQAYEARRRELGEAANFGTPVQAP